MANRLDAQLNLYFGEGTNNNLTHSQSQAQIIHKASTSSSPLSSDEIGAATTNDNDHEDEDEDSSIYSDDIYNVVAWQLGHQRAGSVSDGAAMIEDNQNGRSSRSGRNSKNCLSSRKGLKWYKKLFRLKRLQSDRKNTKNGINGNDEESTSGNTGNGISPNQLGDGTTKSLQHSQSTVHLAPFQSHSDLTQKEGGGPSSNSTIPQSIKLQSPTGRTIRFELLLYEKRGKLRYKLMDHKSSKCISSNARKFDVKRFLSKHRMSIDHELQLIQTIQHYKQIMLRHDHCTLQSSKTKTKKTSKTKNRTSSTSENHGDCNNSEGDELRDQHGDNESTSSSTSDSDISITIDTETLYDDEDCSSFDQRHTTTPRRNLKADSRFMRFEHIVHSVCNRYEQHTAHSPYLLNYASLRKKQQQIELFYRHKVADTHTVAMLCASNLTQTQNVEHLQNPENSENVELSQVVPCPLTSWSTGKSAIKPIATSKSTSNSNRNHRGHKTNRKSTVSHKVNANTLKIKQIESETIHSITSSNVPSTKSIEGLCSENVIETDSENQITLSINSLTDPEPEHEVEPELESQSEVNLDRDLNGYLSDDEDEDDDDDDDDEEEEPSEDDSDASMDSVTLKQILFESQRIQKKAKKQRKAINSKSNLNASPSKKRKLRNSKTSKSKYHKSSKSKNSKLRKGGNSSNSKTTVALKPPSKSTQNSSSPSTSNCSKGSAKKSGSGKGTKTKTWRKLKASEHSKNGRKRIKKRSKRRHVPRFMKSKSATPRRAHKLKTCDMNSTSASDAVRQAATNSVRSHCHSEHHHQFNYHTVDSSIAVPSPSDGIGNGTDSKLKSTKSSKRKRQRQKSFAASTNRTLTSTINRRATISCTHSQHSKRSAFFGGNESADDLSQSERERIALQMTETKCKLQRLSSPQYLRLKTRDSLAKAVPLKLLSFECETD